MINDADFLREPTPAETRYFTSELLIAMQHHI